MVKNPPAMQETQVRSLGWEDPLEERMATHSSILAWRIPWTEEPGGLQFLGWQRVRHRYADDTTLMAESEEELKRLLMKVKEESEKVGLKLNTQKMKIIQGIFPTQGSNLGFLHCRRILYH